MSLKFHVSPVSQRPAQVQEARPRMPSLLDLEIAWDEQPEPRGQSAETWMRARGWSSED